MNHSHRVPTSSVRDLSAATWSLLATRRELAVSALRAQLLPWVQPRVTLGKSVRIGRNVDVRTFDGGEIVIGDRVTISDGAVLQARGGVLEIGDDVFLGRRVEIVATVRVEIAEDSLIAAEVVVLDVDHEFADSGQPIRAQGRRSAPVKIGRNVWLGTRVLVTAGVDVGESSVVAAHSVITRSTPARSLVMGLPGRVVRELWTDRAT